MKRYFLFLILSALFLTAAMGWDYYQKKNLTNDVLSSQISRNLFAETNKLQSELELIINDSTIQWATLSHPFFLLNNGKIDKWSSIEFPITVQELSGDFTRKLIHVSRSELLAVKQIINTNQSLVGIIPLHRGYELTNQYLTEQWNRQVFPVEGIKILEPDQPEGYPVYDHNHCLFKVTISDTHFISNYVSIILVSIAALLFLSFVFVLVRDLHNRKEFVFSFAVLLLSLSLLRVAMVQWTFPGRWVYSKIFDARFFASSSFNASAGDFLFNSLIVFICSAYLFYSYPQWRAIRKLYKARIWIRIAVSSLLIAGAYFSTLFPQLFVESIFHDSVIPFDITESIYFDDLRITVLAALVLGVLSSFFFVHFLVRIVKLCVSTHHFLVSLFLGGLLFLIYFLFSELNYSVTLLVGSLYFIFLFYSGYNKAVATIGYRTFPVIAVIIILYAVQAAVGIKHFVGEKKVKMMLSSATSLYNRDVLGEYLLQQAYSKIIHDPFVAASVRNPLLSKNEARQKIKQLYLNDYFNRYTIKIDFYRNDGSPADKESLVDFASAIEQVHDDAFKTPYEGIYLIQNSNATILKHYLVVAPLNNVDKVNGYVVIDLSIRHIAQQQVYPTLLVDSRFAQSIRNKNFSYATFSQNKLIDHFGDYNFERDFDVKLLHNRELFLNGIAKDTHQFIRVENDNGNSLVLAATLYSELNVIANFSFLFSVGVFLILLIAILFFFKHRFRERHLNYSARIQIFVYLSFVAPLIVVSIMALRMIGLSNETQYENEIQKKGQAIAESLAQLEERGTDIQSNLSGKLDDLSQTQGAEMNLYNSAGELTASSQPAIFKNHLVMRMANRSAWEKIVKYGYYFANEPCRIGLLDYNSSFFAVKSRNTNKLLGILELPFFEQTSNAAKATIFSNIIIAFAFVFILFSFLSLITLQKLTWPLRFIAKRLNATYLSSNQTIHWETNDEIGRLVKEYNKMLRNLEESKSELLKREKENAWREIAQQVAHEIKNPITPMKLTLQQLEYLQAGNKLTEDKTRQSVQILLHQIETLNEIATTFSSFATLPTPEILKINLSDLLRKTVTLFAHHTQGNISYSTTENWYVLGDPKLLGRIFSNIILNGLQSGTNDTHIKVDIAVQPEDDTCVVSIRDNGKGISPELKDKIFLPHFSTKKTGSGLGLAIAKQGIEQMGGEIWFETSKQGSCFYVKLKMI
ncbi:MAG: HAMP domain-containing histidine kinase [Bacteroidetes bacterium]|nr:HAMP domain-containing histidine kinase [Bacteroidota bacterium]